MSCGDDGAPRIPYDIRVTPANPVIGQGLTLQLSATVVDKDGHGIPGLEITFQSSDSSLVSVDATGLVHSLGATGLGFIRTRHGALVHDIAVTVDRRFLGLFVSPESLVINRGLSSQLGAALLDFQGSQYNNNLTDFQSQNPAVATVDAAGNVLAASLGRTTIRVGIDTFSRSVPVLVKQIPDTLLATPPNVVIAPGGSQQLALTVLDQAGVPIPSPALTFQSSNPSLFSVSNAGLVVSLGAAGAGTVRVSLDTLQLTVPVLISGAVPVSLVHTTMTGAAMYEAAIGPAGQMLVSSPSGNTAFTGKLPAFGLQASVATGTLPLGAAITHDGTRGLVASGTGLTVLDIAGDTALPAIPLPGCGDKLSVVVSQDDQRAYVGANDCLYIVNLVSRQISDSVMLSGAIFLALHPTQPFLYAGGGPVREVDLRTRTVRTFSGTNTILGVALSPDGNELYGADADAGSLEVFNTTSGAVTATIPVATGMFGLAASAKWIVATTDIGVAVLDRTTRFLLRMVSVGGLPRRPAIDAGQTTIVVPNEDGWVDFIQ